MNKNELVQRVTNQVISKCSGFRSRRNATNIEGIISKYTVNELKSLINIFEKYGDKADIFYMCVKPELIPIYELDSSIDLSEYVRQNGSKEFYNALYLSVKHHLPLEIFGCNLGGLDLEFNRMVTAQLNGKPYMDEIYEYFDKQRDDIHGTNMYYSRFPRLIKNYMDWRDIGQSPNLFLAKTLCYFSVDNIRQLKYLVSNGIDLTLIRNHRCGNVKYVLDTVQACVTTGSDYKSYAKIINDGYYRELQLLRMCMRNKVDSKLLVNTCERNSGSYLVENILRTVYGKEFDKVSDVFSRTPDRYRLLITEVILENKLDIDSNPDATQLLKDSLDSLSDDINLLKTVTYAVYTIDTISAYLGLNLNTRVLQKTLRTVLSAEGIKGIKSTYFNTTQGYLY